MAERGGRVRESEIKRVLIACQKAGLRKYAVRIAIDGAISIHVGQDDRLPERPNTFDEILKGGL